MEVCKGARFRVLFATRTDGSRPAHDVWQGLDAKTQTSFLVLFKKLADDGRITNPQHFKQQDGEIYAFKRNGTFKLRVYCYYDGQNGVVYLTNIVQKKEDAADPAALKRANTIRLEQNARTAAEKKNKGGKGSASSPTNRKGNDR